MLDCIDSSVTINENIDNAGPPQNGNGINIYILEPEAIIELHGLMLNAAAVSSPVASPAVLAWGLILYDMRNATERRSEERARLLLEDEGDISEERRRSSASSNQALPSSMYDDIIQNVMDSDLKEDPIRYLAGSAIDGSEVFSIIATLATSFGASSGASLQSIFEARLRIILLEVIRCSLDLVQYTPEVVSATLAVLNGSQDSWNASSPGLLLIEDDPISYFLRDEFLTQSILTIAASRYPYERLPFLKMIRAISRCEHDDDEGMPIAALKLKELPTFMMALPSEFRDYETTQEEENNNSVQLLDDLLLFEPRGNMSVLLARGLNSGMEQIVNDFCIPAGSQGRIVLEDNPKVAVWFHSYSGLRYLGKLLETGMTAGDYVDATTGQQTPEEDMVEIISIFTNLLVASKNIHLAKGGAAGSNEVAYKILEEASEGLDRSRDVVSVIFSIFEQELQRQAESATRETSLDLLITCVRFISALVPIVPGRVWPLIGRCSLLDHEGRSGRLATILAGVELINFDYGFLLSCIQLLDALVEDTAKNAIQRKSGSKAVRRFGSTEDLGTGVPENVLSKTILSFSKTMMSVFETSCNWRYAIPEQRLVLSKQISMVLNKIMYYNFGISDKASAKQNLTIALTPAANHVGETFLSSKSGSVRFQPIFRALLDGFATPDITTQLKSFKLWIGQVKEILKLTVSLIRIGNLLERPPSRLQEQLFRVSPLIARLYAIHEVYRLPVVALLDSLVVSAASATGEPPSLLGHLGQETSKNFLSILSQLDKPLNDDMHVIPIWNLMSAVVSNRQQWFAIYLLTGRKPRDKLKEEPAATSAYSSHKPILTIAIEQLTKIYQLPLPRAIAMLEFVSLSQNYWPWAMSSLNTQTDFIKSISSYVNSFQPLAASASIEKSIEGAYHARIAAYVAEILAMYIYHARQTGNLSPIKDLIPNLKFYIASAVAVPSYNSSLHGNMSRNFEKRYPGCNLIDFKRTQLKKRDLGRDYFYDIHLAEKMLEFDSAWKGRNNNGLAEEFVMANVNLSLVDAQVVSAKSFKWRLLLMC
jgi:nuclear pore complex protein Nup188